MKKSILFFFLTFSTTIFSIAQVGIIKGSVKDAKNQEAAIGATVKIEGSVVGALTDIEGNFELKKVPAGVHTILITYIGYTDKKIANVRVEADKTTLINALVSEDNKTLETVTVKAQRFTTSEISVISEIKQVQQIAVGVSGQQIAKTQDRDASGVVRRVPGVSIFDERFIVVRGLNERYNTVLLNDIITPSTEVDVKSFSFDLIPSSAIDRMLVFKSPSADLPGDMAGGAIKIFTKTVPDGNNFSANFSIGYRSNTTLQEALTYDGGKTDWLGVDDATRALPANFPSRKKVIETAGLETTIDKFRNLNPYYTVNQATILPDLRGNINFSRRWFIGSKELTNISYVNYSQTHWLNPVSQNRYNYDGAKTEYFNDEMNQDNIRMGVMSNWALILNPKNKIEFRNLFNQFATKETVTRLGGNIENNLDVSNNAFRWEQRSIYSGQLSGTHEVSAKTKAKWMGGFGYTFRQEPDFRRFTSSREAGSSNPFIINLQQFESPTLQQAARFYSSMDEILGSLRADIEHVIGTKNEDNDEMNMKLKYGIYGEVKDRFFNARWFGIVNPNRINSEILSLTPEKFFTNDNLGSNKVYYSEGTNYDDRYYAQNYLGAGYVSMYLPVNEKFNATVGFRGEFNEQKLQSRERGSGKKINVDNAVFSPLPSTNFTYKINDKNLLRGGFGVTINRPEFRELAPFTYYDFNFDVARRGNSNVKNATIYNYDIRYDLYPSKSELITFGVFYKTFKNPIEAAVFYNGSTVAFTVENAKSAYSAGVELEVRKNITGILKDRLTAVFNASYIKSNVKVSGISDFNRYLQGQSPYLINTGLFYNDDQNGIQANVLYNVIGPRIFVIGDNVLSANVFEMPRHVIDLSISKSINKRLDFKAGVQDLLNQAFRLVQDTNRDNKVSAEDGIYQTYKRGTVSTIGLTYKF